MFEYKARIGSDDVEVIYNGISLGLISVEVRGYVNPYSGAAFETLEEAAKSLKDMVVSLYIHGIRKDTEILDKLTRR